MQRLMAVLLLMTTAPDAAADEQRWVTFKTARNDWGLIHHQIDRQTIRPEGAYRTFWTRMWRAQKKEPLVASYYGSLIFSSRKFAVDCTNRKFGPSFIDSNLPNERKRKANPAVMRWQDFKTFPAVERTVCGR
jgi:hypothetical protein